MSKLSETNLRIEDLEALRQLGVLTLVMDKNGMAIAVDHAMIIDDNLGNGWIQKPPINYNTKGFFPKILDNYYLGDWKDSLIDITQEIFEYYDV